MATESDFLREIRDNPDDDFLMLVYADWLDEQGYSLGELIRVEVEMRQSSGTQFSRLRRRADVLREEMGVPPRIEECPACVAGEGYRITTITKGPMRGYADHRRCPYCGYFTRKWFHSIHEVVTGVARFEGAEIARKVRNKLRHRERRLQKKLERTGG